MNKINWENYPSIRTPINAENLNAMQDNIEEAINDKNIMTAYITSEYTITTSSVYEKIPLNQSIGVGNKLFFRNYSIEIGAGVSYVKISANLQLNSSGLTTGGKNFVIRKNGTTVSRRMFNIQNVANYGETLSPVIIEVQEGDKIDTAYYGTSGNILAGGQIFNNLTVEVIK